MSAAYTIAHKAAGTWVRQGDLTKRQAIAAAKQLRAAGVVAFVYPTASINLVTFA